MECVDENSPDRLAVCRETADGITAGLEGLGERLRADRVGSGAPYYVEADETGRVIYRDVHTDREWTPDDVQRWRDEHPVR